MRLETPPLRPAPSPAAHSTGWTWDLSYFHALFDNLRGLEWHVTQLRIDITYIALDFEVTSGLDLPISRKKAQQAKQATDPSTSAGISLAVRVLCIRSFSPPGVCRPVL